MLGLPELPVVEETRDLVPNLPLLTRALFGEQAFLATKPPRLSDWITGEIKYGDGLLWLPWKGQLWLIEVEWKPGSNFGQQAKTFARGAVNVDRLKQALRETLAQVSPVLDKRDRKHSIDAGTTMNCVVDQTMEAHLHGQDLVPHIWVILGHSAGNEQTLRNEYLRELHAWFKGQQTSILSTARMFRGSTGTFVLLEQTCGENCGQFASVPRSLLVPAIASGGETSLEPVPSAELGCNELAGPKDEIVQRVSAAHGHGHASRIWDALVPLLTAMGVPPDREKVKLVITGFGDPIRLNPAWDDTGRYLNVLDRNGCPTRGGTWVGKLLGQNAPSKFDHVAKVRGTFVYVGEGQERVIVRYQTLQNERRGAKRK
jgi:hypothetical protein